VTIKVNKINMDEYLVQENVIVTSKLKNEINL
jgi:hypothetical protein